MPDHRTLLPVYGPVAVTVAQGNTEAVPHHPAPFSKEILLVLEQVVHDEAARLGREPWILDPFAGIGRVHELGSHTIGVELEEEWASAHRRTVCGDSTCLLYTLWYGGRAAGWFGAPFDMIVTSPCYGNRMADHHEAKDASVRNTYRHRLGRMPSTNSGAILQYGEKYKTLHAEIYEQAVDPQVLTGDGLFVLNVSNFYRRDKLIDAVSWHQETIEALGFVIERAIPVKTRRNKFGANGSKRADEEWVLTYRNQRGTE